MLPPPPGRLMTGVKRKCSRNVSHSLSPPLLLSVLDFSGHPVELKEVTQKKKQKNKKKNPLPPASCKKKTKKQKKKPQPLDHVFFFQSSNSRDKHTPISPSVCLCDITFLGLCVGDLQVAVPGSQLLPAHDLPLQVLQRDVRAVKHHRVVAEFGGEFIMNMSHAGMKEKESSSHTVRQTAVTFSALAEPCQLLRENKVS